MSSGLALLVQHRVVAAVERIHVELDSLVAAARDGAVEGLPDADLVEVMLDLHRAADRITAVASGATHAVNIRDAGRADGFVSTKRLLEVRAGKSPGAAAATVAVATAVRADYRETGAAWLAGEVSADAVTAITRTIGTALRGVPTGRVIEERSRFEAGALHAARTGTVADVRQAVAGLRVVITPEEVDAAAVAVRDAQFLRFTPVQDGVDVAGFLTTETAAKVLTALDQRVSHYHRSGQLSDAEGRTLDSPAAASGARRGLRERLNVDALTDLVTHLLDGGLLGTKHEQRPHVTVTVHADDHATGRGGTILLPGFGEVPVSSTTISRILCDAQITPVLTTREPIVMGHRSDDPALLDPTDVATYAPWGTRAPGDLPDDIDDIDDIDDVEDAVEGDHGSPVTIEHPRRRTGRSRGQLTLVEPTPAPDPPEPGPPPPGGPPEDQGRSDRDWVTAIITANTRRVIDVGRTSRTAPPRLRKALEVRDRSCRFPGCSVDASRTEAHHIIHWEHGGRTDLDNMVLLCAAHHHLVHEGRWTITTRRLFHPGDPEFVLFTPPPPRRRRV